MCHASSYAATFPITTLPAVFRQGDIGTSWYAVLSGSLDVKVSETANHQVRLRSRTSSGRSVPPHGFHGRQCPSEIIQYRKTSEKKATGSFPRRHSVASAHVSPLRRASVQRAEESRLRSSARYALYASAWKWDYSERERGRNRLLVRDADKEPPHCGTFFSCV